TWFRTDPPEVPALLKSVYPIPLVEVLDTEPLVETPPDERDNLALYKISPQLWARILKDETRVERVEIQLAITPKSSGWQEALTLAASSLFIEGYIGPQVTGLIRLGQVKNLAAVPLVSGIRLPLPAHVQVDPAIKIKGDSARALEQSGLDMFH